MVLKVEENRLLHPGQQSAASTRTSADIWRFRTLLGDKEFETKFGKSETHTCGSHAKCGASSGILNWTPTAADKCKADGGYVVEDKDGKKVARKA